MKAHPDKTSFGVPATGSLPHFFALMMAEKTGVTAQVIGYRGSGPLLNDLMGGHLLKSYRAQWAPVVQRSGYEP